MKHRNQKVFASAYVVVLSLVFAACGSKEVPPPPPPAPVAAAATPAPPPAPPSDDGAAAARTAAEEAARRRAALDAMVFFDYDVATIRPDAKATLDAKVQILRVEPAITLRIDGHADERGSTEYNLALSIRRAISIREYIAGYGIPTSRLTVNGLGEERPLAPGSGESAWSRNRRGEFTVTGGLSASR